ncbi:transcription elongation factor A protein-like 9 [Neofelis nebulosa]|uniref:transcription elongation factor A protein-like 9 n=1 Tax=Neofelis nebulosa TaxID=61452 RepID=UPI002729E43E|nr:transcription elongation factor A protein-like 9 [Neofelis nebulosa]
MIALNQRKQMLRPLSRALVHSPSIWLMVTLLPSSNCIQRGINQKKKKKKRKGKKEERKGETHKMKSCQKIEGKPENESEPKLNEEPKPEEKPEVEEEPEEEEKTEGTFRERLIQSHQEFKEDIHNRHLSKEDMFREVSEIEEIRRVRNKLIVMHWKVN